MGTRVDWYACTDCFAHCAGLGLHAPNTPSHPTAHAATAHSGPRRPTAPPRSSQPPGRAAQESPPGTPTHRTLLQEGCVAWLEVARHACGEAVAVLQHQGVVLAGQLVPARGKSSGKAVREKEGYMVKRRCTHWAAQTCRQGVSRGKKAGYKCVRTRGGR